MFRPFLDEVRVRSRDIVRLREKLSADRFPDSPTWARASPAERVDWLFREVERLRAHRDDLMAQNAELAKRAAHATKDCLRAQRELEAMKKQEPVAEVAWAADIPNSITEIRLLQGYVGKIGDKLYLAPGAQENDYAE